LKKVRSRGAAADERPLRQRWRIGEAFRAAVLCCRRGELLVVWVTADRTPMSALRGERQ
jgi:hypothetical protein